MDDPTTSGFKIENNSRDATAAIKHSRETIDSSVPAEVKVEPRPQKARPSIRLMLRLHSKDDFYSDDYDPLDPNGTGSLVDMNNNPH